MSPTVNNIRISKATPFCYGSLKIARSFLLFLKLLTEINLSVVIIRIFSYVRLKAFYLGFRIELYKQNDSTVTTSLSPKRRYFCLSVF